MSDWWRIQRAMSLHHSQYTWFRKLYMAFSRYVLINTFDKLVVNRPAAQQQQQHSAARLMTHRRR